MKSSVRAGGASRKTLLPRKSTKLSGKAKSIGKEKARPRAVLSKKSDRELVKAFGER